MRKLALKLALNVFLLFGVTFALTVELYQRPLLEPAKVVQTVPRAPLALESAD